MHSPNSFSRHALLRAVRMSALALALPLAASAQVVRGTVVDEASGRGLPGVVVVLLDSLGNRLAGVLADDDGRYAIRTTVPGRYAIRADRIGYRSDAATPVALEVGQTVELKLVTRPIPVVLGAVRVTGRSPCVARASDGREVSEVWEETRKALYATDLTQQQELFTARVSRYERTLDAQTGRVTGFQTKQATTTTRSPFVSSPAAELSARGYVRQGSGSETVYYAPDAGVLLSDEFLRDHCFRLRDGDGRRSGQIGLAFEPVKGRDKPDISGTLWIDRKTAELRDLEFSYSRLPNLPDAVKSGDFGGHTEFHRMPTGAWIVERWVIRMPVLADKGTFAAQPPMVVPGAAAPRPDRIQLAAVREEGGEVIETVARGARREVAAEVASVRGMVFDSTRMRPLAGARVFLDGTQFATQSGADGSFTIAQVPAATYAVSVVHPRFDSLGVTPPSVTVPMRANEESVAQLAGPSAATIIRRDCAVEERAAGRATLRGHVRDGFTSGPAIDAQVTLSWNRLQTSGRVPVGVAERRLVTRTDSAGRYDVCGLPDGVRLTALVTADDRRSAPVQVVLPADEVSVLDLVVGRPTVVASAEPAAIAAPAAAGTASRASRNRTVAEFERRRRRGNGAYLTRQQIDQMHASRLTDLLRTLPGVSVEPNESGALVVELRRAKTFVFEPVTVARNDSSASSAAPGQTSGKLNVRKCPAAFQVDGLPIDGGGTVDIEVRPETVEAIEVYSAGQVPIELGVRNTECGVVMIWTRAFMERSTPAPGSNGDR